MLCGCHAEHILIGMQLMLGTWPAHRTAKSRLLGLPLWQTTWSCSGRMEGSTMRQSTDCKGGQQKTDSDGTALWTCDMGRSLISCAQYSLCLRPKTRLRPGRG